MHNYQIVGSGMYGAVFAHEAKKEGSLFSFGAMKNAKNVVCDYKT